MNFVSPIRPASSLFYKSPLSSNDDGQEGDDEYKCKDISQCTHIVSFTTPEIGQKSISVGPGVDLNGDHVFQTTNPVRVPEKKDTLGVSWYERCVVNKESNGNVGQMWGVDGKDTKFYDCVPGVEGGDGVQGVKGIWFIGSYSWPGIPLLEGCVGSAVRVVEGISRAEGVEVDMAPIFI
jgi:hypothetical protein